MDPPSTTAAPAGAFATRRMALLLALVLVVAAVLRARLAIRSPLWFEEIYFLLIARHSTPEVLQTVSRDIHPPLAFLLRHGWTQIGGESPMWHKSLSIALSLASLPVAWRLFARVFDRRVALITCAFMAVTFALVRYGQEVGMYQLQWLLALLVVDFGTLWLENGARSDAAAWVAAAIVALWTHYVFLVIQALLLVWGAVRLRSDRKKLGAWLMLHALVLAGFVPQLPSFLEQVAREGTLRYSSFPTLALLEDFARKLCLSHTPLVPAFAALALVPLLDRKRAPIALLLWLLVIIPPLAIRVLPATLPNEFLFAAPFWLALVSAGFDGTPLRPIRLAAAIVLIALATRWCWQSPPFREGVALHDAIEHMRPLRAPGDLVVHAESHSLLSSLYYDPAARNRLLLVGGGAEYFDGGLVIPDSLRITPEAFQAERERGVRWWALSVDRARVARNEVTRAGAAEARAFAGLARGRRRVDPPVTLWEGQPAATR